MQNYSQPEQVLPSGRKRYKFDQVDYRPLFKDPDCPNPLVIRWNGHGLYTPILLVCQLLIINFANLFKDGNYGQYYTGSVKKLLQNKMRAAINRVNVLHAGLPPLNISEEMWPEDINEIYGPENSQSFTITFICCFVFF